MELVASRFVSSTLPSPHPHHSNFFDTLLLTSHKRSSLLSDEVLYATPTWRRCYEGLPCTRHQHTTADSRAGWIPQKNMLNPLNNTRFNIKNLNTLSAECSRVLSLVAWFSEQLLLPHTALTDSCLQ
jgi:hypothetical protein